MPLFRRFNAETFHLGLLQFGRERIGAPATFNAILAAIAGVETRFNRIQQMIGVERGPLSSSLRTLLEPGWIRRELLFGVRSDHSAIYTLLASL